MVGSPVVHHTVDILEGILLRIETRGEPGCRPGRIGTLVENGVDLRINVHNPALCDLENRAETVHDVDSGHCGREIPTGNEMDAESASTEVVPVGRHPLRVLKTAPLVLLCHLPERFHHRLSLGVRALAAAVHGRGSGVDEVDDSWGGLAGKFLAGHPLDGLRTPVRPDIGEDLRTVGQKMCHQHGGAVEGVVLGGEDGRLATAVPVEVGVQKSLREVTVRHPVSPLALTLETAGDGVVAECLLLESQLAELRIAVHEIHHDDGHLDHELPILVLLLAGLALAFRILVPALVRHAVFPYPGHCLLKLLRIVYSQIHTPQDLDLIDALIPHAQVLLEEVRVHDRAGDAHRHATD